VQPCIDIIALANATPDMGALLHFDISNNNIRAEGGKALVEALKGNQVITTLSIAKNNLSFNSSSDKDMSGVAALADVISDMGALSTFTFSGDRADSTPVTMETSMVEVDFGGKGLRASGAIMVAAFLPKCT
jgi:hypothetical protein